MPLKMPSASLRPESACPHGFPAKSWPHTPQESRHSRGFHTDSLPSQRDISRRNSLSQPQSITQKGVHARPLTTREREHWFLQHLRAIFLLRMSGVNSANTLLCDTLALSHSLLLKGFRLESCARYLACVLVTSLTCLLLDSACESLLLHAYVSMLNLCSVSAHGSAAVLTWPVPVQGML